jgi:hypothetical protein
MGEGTSVPRRGWGPLGIAFVTVLLGAAALAAFSPSAALACATTDNGGGSYTCTSDPFPDACTGISSYIVVYIPVDAVIDSHQLLPPNPVCPNATRTEDSFEDNATGNNGDGTFPSPGAGQKAVRVKYTIVCGGSCSGTVDTSLKVTYHQPTSGGGGGGGTGGGSIPPTSSPKPSANGESILANISRAHGAGWYEVACLEPVACAFFLDVVAPEHHSRQALSAKSSKLGTARGTIPGGTKGRIPLRLNKLGRKKLSQKGKLRTRVTGTVTTGAEVQPFSAPLVLKLTGKG